MAANRFNREDGTFAAIGSGDVLSVSAATIIGTTAGDNAAAGIVGEYAETEVTNAAAINLTTGSTTQIASVALTAGDWDVRGAVAFKGNAATLVSFLLGSISTSSTAIDGTKGRRCDLFYASTATVPVFALNNNPQATLAVTRMNSSASVTAFLIAQGSFATSTCSAYGIIAARRVR